MRQCATKLKKNGVLILILALYIGVKLFQLSRYHLLIWDEAVYVGMGKWLFSGGTVGMFETIRPVVFPLILGFFWRVGLPVVLLGEITQILFGVGIIMLSYSIGKQVFNKPTGLIAAFLISVTPVFFLYSNYLLVGTTSTFFVLLAIRSFINKGYLAAGIFAAIAFLTRFPQGLLLIALSLVFGLMILKRRKAFSSAAKLGIGYAVTTVPFLIFNYFMYRTKTSTLKALIRPLILAFSHQNNLFNSVGGGLYNIFYYFIILFSQNWLFAFVVPALVFISLKKLYNQRKVQVLLITLGVYIAYFSYIINKQERFALAFLPLFAILAGYGLWGSYSFITSSFKIKRGAAFAGFGVIIMLMACHPLATDISYLGWRSLNPPRIVDEFYSYFNHHPTEKAILTADPVPAAYSNALFIPAVRDVPTAKKIMEQWIKSNNTDWIMFKLSSYPCLDASCMEQRDQLVELVKQNTLVFNKSYYGEPYLIYKIRH